MTILGAGQITLTDLTDYTLTVTPDNFFVATSPAGLTTQSGRQEVLIKLSNSMGEALSFTWPSSLPTVANMTITKNSDNSGVIFTWVANKSIANDFTYSFNVTYDGVTIPIAISVAVNKQGEQGIGISSVVTYYQLTNSNSQPAADSADWSTTCPTIIKGRYLWTKIVTTYSNNEKSIEYKVEYQALDGEPGQPGAPGQPGNPGTRGTQWFVGTAITGKSTTDATKSSSLVGDFIVGDMYLNNGTSSSAYNVYRCITAGSGTASVWAYVQNIKGAAGESIEGPQGQGIAEMGRLYYSGTSEPSVPTSKTATGWTTTIPEYKTNKSIYYVDYVIFNDSAQTFTCVGQVTKFDDIRMVENHWEVFKDYANALTGGGWLTTTENKFSVGKDQVELVAGMMSVIAEQLKGEFYDANNNNKWGALLANAEMFGAWISAGENGANKNIVTSMTFTSDGLQISKQDSTGQNVLYNVLITDTGVSIRKNKDELSRFRKEQLTVNNVRIASPTEDSENRIIMKQAPDGGIAFVSGQGLKE